MKEAQVYIISKLLGMVWAGYRGQTASFLNIHWRGGEEKLEFLTIFHASLRLDCSRSICSLLFVSRSKSLDCSR